MARRAVPSVIRWLTCFFCFWACWPTMPSSPTDRAVLFMREFGQMDQATTVQVTPQMEAQEAARRHKGRIRAVAVTLSALAAILYALSLAHI